MVSKSISDAVLLWFSAAWVGACEGGRQAQLKLVPPGLMWRANVKFRRFDDTLQLCCGHVVASRYPGWVTLLRSEQQVLRLQVGRMGLLSCNTTVPVRAAPQVAQRPTNTKTTDNPLCATRRNSTTMATIDDAIVAIDSLEPREHYSYREVAWRFNVSNSTLTRRHKGR